MTTDSLVIPKPGNTVIRIGGDARPWIAGFRCDVCGAAVTERTMACRACASRTPPAEFRAVETGRLHTWSVVHRSYPGVAVPFVSAIVDLDDGLTLKGTLRGVDADALRHGLPVALVFDDAGGAHDKEGVPYVGFHFQPRENQA
ncbi:Zn-ribbon domain-containing OB-fold protein [Novosphingobium sp. JCM 18896]|uniref:Zn-ribbon domain-containing OB-fold protein n=1 Tax=Novosphingobium sp. JCM 18896 TaxID=2989731 RepID=UPI002221DB37|nr:OB-fold domain-containing protein [Novosphingobium sp. JCM 18896]MCW1428346.1 OB-fold domain-containing protein [Novosphingobium sp. JCM 18896]